MAKTNYDVMLENMTIDKMTDFLNDTTQTNSCLVCVYKGEEWPCPNFSCRTGIKLWLLKEADERDEH